MPQLHYNGQLQEITKYPMFFKDKRNQVVVAISPNRFLMSIEYDETGYVSCYDSAVFYEADNLVEIDSNEATLTILPVFNKAMERFTELMTAIKTEPKAPENTEMEVADAD